MREVVVVRVDGGREEACERLVAARGGGPCTQYIETPEAMCAHRCEQWSSV